MNSVSVNRLSALVVAEPWTVLFEEPWAKDDAPEEPWLWTDLDTILTEHPETVLYCIDWDTQALIYLDLGVGGRSQVMQEAFLDRAIRKIAPTGGHVYAVPFAAAADYVDKVNTSEWQMSWVWNTGRCGSTLMHKVLSSAGVSSFSEPFWFDQLSKTRDQD